MSASKSRSIRWLRLVVLAAFAAGLFLAWQLRACTGLGLGTGAGMGMLAPDTQAPAPPAPEEPAAEAPAADAAPARPCALYLDSAGLTVDGTPADVDQAVAACRRAGKARLRATGGARAGTYDALVQALERAGVRIEPG